mgnify:CR=1 FL=1
MCIRDRIKTEIGRRVRKAFIPRRGWRLISADYSQVELRILCLLYTSDAADERSSVDLGGRRIIKKKTDRDRTDVGHRRENVMIT